LILHTNTGAFTLKRASLTADGILGKGQNDEMVRTIDFLLGREVLARALVLLSGGIDSATALYLTKRECDDIYTMNMVYTETYDSESEASRKLAKEAQVKEHLSIYLPFFKDLESRYRPEPSSTISPAYLPARNIVFYGIAVAYAETLGANKIVFGSNADDTRELPDARPSFIRLMNELVRVGTRAGTEGRSIEIVNPMLEFSKTDVLKLAIKLKVPLQLTWSCYENTKTPCGKCRGCRMRSEAFLAAGMADPLGHVTSA
jgi:7-cyano-7-deazaguanine synthase